MSQVLVVAPRVRSWVPNARGVGRRCSYDHCEVRERDDLDGATEGIIVGFPYVSRKRSGGTRRRRSSRHFYHVECAVTLHLIEENLPKIMGLLEVPAR